MIGELFTKYGSDKDWGHSYGPFYDELLTPHRDRITAVLEVGILTGASLRAWRDFFPFARVTGLDIAAELVHEERIDSVRADSSKADQVNSVLETRRFDLIVDDGIHSLAEQAMTRNILWPRLRTHGLYVIEDLQLQEAMDFFAEQGAEIVDFRHLKGRADDVLALFRKAVE
jgi:trans-aconitate methyltransferase